MADGFESLVGDDLGGLDDLQLAATPRAATVGEGEALTALGALGAVPCHDLASAAHPVFVGAGGPVAPLAGVGHRIAVDPGRGGVFEVRQDGTRRTSAGAHGQDDGCATGDDVAAGEHPRQACGLVDRVGLHIAAVVEFEPRGGAGDDGVGVGAEGDDHRVALDLDLLAGGHRLASAAVVGLAEFHAFEQHAADNALAVGENLERVVKPHEADAFFLGVVQLLDACRGLITGAAVYASHLGTQPPCHPQAVHRRVAGADYDDVAADADRGVDLAERVGAHQVHPGEEFVGADHPSGVLAGDAEEGWGAGAHPEEHGVEAAWPEQILDGEDAPDDLVGFDAHAEVEQTLDLAVDDLAGKTERRDAVAQHAPGHVQCLEHGDLYTAAGEIGSTRQAGGAGTDDGHLLADRRRDRFRWRGAVVADEPLEATDGDGFHLAGDHALDLALGFLGAHPPTHRRQDAGLTDDTQRPVDVFQEQVADEPRDVDLHRAAADAGGAGALEAALGLAQRLGEGVPHRDLVEGARPGPRIAHRHGDLGGLDLAEFLVGAAALYEELLLHGTTVGVVGGSGLLFAAETLLAGEHFVEVDAVGIEVRPVHAGEAGVTVDRDPARAAHAGAVDHDRVERYDGVHVVVSGDLGAGPHHHHRPDGHHQVGSVVRHHLGQGVCHQPLPPGAAVVGAHDQLVGPLGQTIGPEHQVGVAEADDRRGAVTGLFERAQLGEHRRGTKAATDQHNMTAAGWIS